MGTVNEQLRPKFLDLKEGAYVVSLAPFVPSLNARVTERNVRIPSFLSSVFRLYIELTSRDFPFAAGRRHQRDLRRVGALVSLGECVVGEQRGDVLYPPRGPGGVREHPRAV